MRGARRLYEESDGKKGVRRDERRGIGKGRRRGSEEG